MPAYIRVKTSGGCFKSNIDRGGGGAAFGISPGDNDCTKDLVPSSLLNNIRLGYITLSICFGEIIYIMAPLRIVSVHYYERLRLKLRVA
jgi:hypothetical protein